MKFVATINVPGYLPMSDDPPVFDTAEQDSYCITCTLREAWRYLYGERERDLDDPMNDEDGDEDQCLDEIEGMIDNPETGTVYGRTPGYDGEHDQGLAYSVTEVES
jgi:hypothetical protein